MPGYRGAATEAACPKHWGDAGEDRGGWQGWMVLPLPASVGWMVPWPTYAIKKFICSGRGGHRAYIRSEDAVQQVRDSIGAHVNRVPDVPGSRESKGPGVGA